MSTDGGGGIKPVYKIGSTRFLPPFSCAFGGFCLVFIMGFGDLKSASGLKVLNDFLSDRSYIEGSVNCRTAVKTVDKL